MEENEEREDCITQVANIADLRSFRTIAMSAYDDAVKRGVKPVSASELAIAIVYLMNESNKRERLFEFKLNGKTFEFTADQCNTAYNIIQSFAMIRKG